MGQNLKGQRNKIGVKRNKKKGKLGTQSLSKN